MWRSARWNWMVTNQWYDVTSLTSFFTTEAPTVVQRRWDGDPQIQKEPQFGENMPGLGSETAMDSRVSPKQPIPKKTGGHRRDNISGPESAFIFIWRTKDTLMILWVFPLISLKLWSCLFVFFNQYWRFWFSIKTQACLEKEYTLEVNIHFILLPHPTSNRWTLESITKSYERRYMNLSPFRFT